MKGESDEAANWNVLNQEFTVSEIRLAIKYGLPSSMQDELEDHQEYYHSLNYEDWCVLQSKIEVKDQSKRAANQINNIASDRAVYISDRDEYTRIPRNNKANTGILRSKKGPQKKANKRHGTQHYCVLCKKALMPEKKYMSHSSDDCTGIRTNLTIKDGMGGSVGSR